MLDTEIEARPIMIRTRIAQAGAWLKSWNESAGHLLLAILEQNRISVRETVSVNRILSVEWDDKTVIVWEFQDSPRSYRFQDMTTAIVFLNAVLMRHVADLTEPRPVSNFPFSPVFGAV
jgi:hypothetical protein